MASVTITAHVAAGVERLNRLIEAIGPKPILAVVGARLMSYVQESFQTKGRGRWKPLSELTLRLRRHGGDAPLQDTGRLKQSYTTETDERTWVEVGSNLKTPNGRSLAAIHEYGTGPYTITARRARVLAARTREGEWILFGKKVQHPGIPARPVLPTREEAERLVAETVRAMFDQVTRESSRSG